MFDPELIKKHPYATGGAVLVGGIILFVLLSRGESSSAATTSSSSGLSTGAYMQDQLQMAQISAASSLQQNAQNVQLQTAQLSADTANNQTAAALKASDLQTIAGLAASTFGTQAQVAENATNVNAQTVQQQNQLTYAENIQQMQDNVLMDQINQGSIEQANNNATALAGTQITANYQLGVAQLQAGVATAGLTDATNLATNQQNITASTLPYILDHAGDQKNSALDATDQTGIFQTILSGGNSTVAATGTAVSGGAANSGNAATASATKSIMGGISSIASSLGAGFFG